MKKRTPLGDLHVPYLQHIHDSKQGAVRATLDAIEHDWFERFEEYESHFDVASMGALPRHHWDSDDRMALLHCYNSGTSALSSLKVQILEAQDVAVQGLCPYCGVGTTEEFDHYAPKETFPHVAIHALNLVPCCGRCNRKKSQAWTNIAGERKVLHFYLDRVPTEQFVFATVGWRNTSTGPIATAQYRLERPVGFSGTDFALIERHFHQMELLDHYRKNTPRAFTDLKKVAKIARPRHSRTAIRDTLQGWAEDSFTDEGFGSWRGALALALSADNRFLTQMATP